MLTAPVATPDPAASTAPAPDQAKPDALKQIAKSLTESAATYLGLKSIDLATQLKAGKSLADLAAAKAGKSRDGLIAAVTAAAKAKIDTAVAVGTLSAAQAAMSKHRLSTRSRSPWIALGTSRPFPPPLPTPDRSGPASRCPILHGAGVGQRQSQSA